MSHWGGGGGGGTQTGSIQNVYRQWKQATSRHICFQKPVTRRTKSSELSGVYKITGRF